MLCARILLSLQGFCEIRLIHVIRVRFSYFVSFESKHPHRLRLSPNLRWPEEKADFRISRIQSGHSANPSFSPASRSTHTLSLVEFFLLSPPAPNPRPHTPRPS